VSSPSRTLDPEAAADQLSRLYRLVRPRRLRGDTEFHYLARTLRKLLHDHWRAEKRKPPTDATLDEDRDAAGGGDPEVAALAGEVYSGARTGP
jgi:DNA-directed RNA polymerase specialized sigma24 family protein